MSTSTSTIPYDRHRLTPTSSTDSVSRPCPGPRLRSIRRCRRFDGGSRKSTRGVAIQPVANVQLTVGHRYLNDNPFFENSSLFVVGGYYRIDDNWGVGIQEQYEATTRVLEQQRYSIYRDLTSWVASLGAVVRDNDGVKEYGVLLTFTLKAFPKFGFDLNFDPAGAGRIGMKRHSLC